MKKTFAFKLQKDIIFDAEDKRTAWEMLSSFLKEITEQEEICVGHALFDYFEVNEE